MSGSVHPARRAVLVVALAALTVPGVLSTVTLSGLAAAAGPPPGSSDADPAALVHPLDGTATGPVSPGTVGEFPGADVPFGMLQWSPDTSPNAVQAGGGYDYDDSSINGFSLTHLSGTGCPSYQDVPILPVEGAVTSPATTVARFSHAEEQASPGRYHVVLGGQGQARIPVSLAVTTRSGISSFTFPAGTESNVLFKVADSSNPVTASSVRLVGHDEVEGQVSSGQFCGTGTSYTLHFVALVRPTVLVGGNVVRRRRCARHDGVHGDNLRFLRDVRHVEGPSGADEGRRLVRQHPGRAAEPPG